MKRSYSFLSECLIINFINDKGSTFPLKFKLYDHPGTKRWLELIKETSYIFSKVSKGGLFFGNAFTDVNYLIDLIKNNVESHNHFIEHNKLSPDFKIPITIDSPVTQKRLNELHDQFERLVEDKAFSDLEYIQENLQMLNINIHKTEGCIGHEGACHIEITTSTFHQSPLTEDVLTHFSPDYVWGELLLNYGITGVPTVNAFRSNSNPRPQDFMTNGMMISFWGDLKFDKYEELETWLIGQGIDVKDPKAALGYLPLGIIDGLENFEHSELLNKIKQHQRIDEFEFIPKTLERKYQEAKWPYDPEIHYNLDLVPYIDLKVAFDGKELVKEALEFKKDFVVHREYDQISGKETGKWKSLGLRTLFGDHTKTNYHTEYEFDGDPVYSMTKFATLCPLTMKFLNGITDVTKCERIRFMLLEPGASIKVHRDSSKPTSLAVNISLNMPEDCEMHAQLNSDGTENPYTVKLPFEDSGSVLLFNNAKYHKVVNNSSFDRIHIIFHGPIKFSDEELINLAKKQNKITDRLELMKKLVQKKSYLGEDIAGSKELMSAWLSAGLQHDSLPTNMTLAIYDHKSYFSGHDSSLHLEKRTLATLFPLNATVINENEWDKLLASSFQQGKSIVFLMAAGTFLNNLNNFINSAVHDANDLLAKGWPAAGHLLDFNNGKHLPYFHEQFIIINLKVWDEIGRPRLGQLFSPAIAELKAHISFAKKHDDYTPEFIKAPQGDEDVSIRSGEFGWGSDIVLRAVQNGLGVQNLSDATRFSKSYSYPRDELNFPKTEIEKAVQGKLNFSKKEVFYFNNEPLHALDIPDFKPDTFVLVAAGMKPFHILRQFKASEKSQIHFRDFSHPALNYIEAVSRVDTIQDLEFTIVSKMKSDPLKKYSPEGAVPLLKNTVRDYFEGSPEVLMNAIKLTKHATFEEVDLISNPEKISDLVKPQEKFFIWISNAFYNNQLYLILTRAEADNALLKLVNLLAAKANLKAFRYKETHNFVFGKEIGHIEGALVDGSVREVDYTEASWNEISFG